MSPPETFEIKRYHNGVFKADRVSLADESRVDIQINGIRRASVMATPRLLDWLALGFMFGERIIFERSDVIGLEVDGLLVKVEIAPGGGRPQRLADRAEFAAAHPRRSAPKAKIGAEQVLILANKFQGQSQLFQLTGGVHSCWLVNGAGQTYFAEDVARHNALDKVVGQYLDLGHPGEESVVLVASGRVSTEFVLKSARAGCLTVISLGAATDQAIELARRLKMTLIGFVRGDCFNVYSGSLEI